MEFENLLTLIKTVSDSSVTGFQYEQDGVKLSIQKEVVQQVVEYHGDATAKVVVPEKVQEEESVGNVIKSPLVGRFYVAPTENAEPFVVVGDSVKKGQTVAIVEAMKLMNDIESDFDGVVAEVFVENGESVEYGQPLFRIV